MSERQAICPNCRMVGVVLKEMESGGKLYWNINTDSPHSCGGKRQAEKYWCAECNAGIPIRNLCIHKRLKEKGLLAYG